MPFVRKLFQALKKLFKRRKHRRRKKLRSPSRRARRGRRLVRRKSRGSSSRRIVKNEKRLSTAARTKPKIKTVPVKKIQAKAADKIQVQNFPSRKGVSSHQTGAVLPKPAELILVPVGVVTHYFSKIMVCVVKVSGPGLNVGDRIKLKGSRTDFVQRVNSLQIESVDVRSARKDQLVGLKVDQACCVGDQVFKVFPGKT